MGMSPCPAGAQLRRVLASRKGVPAPGVFCGLVARMARQRGFQVGYVSGAALTASAGVPDIGVLTLDHFASRIRELTRVTTDGNGDTLPLICDADTGFGEGEMVRRTVFEYANAGAAALHLEDQVFPKRCGHLKGKSLVPAADFAEKVTAAREASDTYADGDFVICARTDARGVSGMEDAISRASLYVDAGADMIFPEGLQSEAEFAEFGQAMQKLKRPPMLLANMTEFGQTPYLSAKRYGEMGYHVVIHPVTTLRCAMKGVANSLDHLADETGTVEPILDSMFSRKELYESLGYTPGEEWKWPSPTK